MDVALTDAVNSEGISMFDILFGFLGVVFIIFLSIFLFASSPFKPGLRFGGVRKVHGVSKIASINRSKNVRRDK